MAITRGDEGMTRLVLRHAGTIVADFHAAGRIYEDRTNRQIYDVSMQTLTNGGLFRGKWIKFHVQLRTSSDWARLEVPGVPYLLAVEDPMQKAVKATPCSTQPLELRSPSPGRETVSARAVLCVPYPENDDLHLVIHQGVQGRSRLELAGPRFRISAVRDDRYGDKGQRLVDYTLSRVAIQNLFEPLPKPWRWQLDEWEMTDGWHEYTCYLTWAGLALALCGGVAISRRHWPLLVAGGVALLIAMGAALPVEPLVDRRPLAAVWLIAGLVAVPGGRGIRAGGLRRLRPGLAGPVGRAISPTMGTWRRRLRRLVEGGVLLVVYAELVMSAWSVFSEVFVCRLADVPPHDAFASRYASDEVRPSAMYSAHCPYGKANSGVLRDYENIAVPRGDIRLEGDPAYRGEAYLHDRHGTARITAWSMSQVTVDTRLTAPDQLVLNQNFFSGWKAKVHDAEGHASGRPVLAKDGLVSVALQPGDRAVEFYYLPDSFLWGAWISALTAVGCLGACLSARAGDGTTAGTMYSWSVRCGAWLKGLVQSRAVMLTAAVLGLNVPFLLGHPAWTPIELPALRALAVALVLLVLPGWPLVAAMVRRGWLAPECWVARIAASMGIFAILIIVLHVAGIEPRAALVWNATWIVANLGIVVFVIASRSKPGIANIAPSQPASWLTLVVFAAAFLVYAHAATSIVPKMDDHDFETQGTAYSLVHDLGAQAAHGPAHHLLLRPSAPAPCLRSGIVSVLE